VHVSAFEDVERARGTADAQEGARLAPEVFARAEQERSLAARSHLSGDEVGSELHAERAIATYQHALVAARLARAAAERADAQTALEEANARARALGTARDDFERQAAELQADLGKWTLPAHERFAPTETASEIADRDRQRLATARALVWQAQVLCDAARLLGTDRELTDGLNTASAEVERVERGASGPAWPGPGGPAPEAPSQKIIDEAADARVHCLDLLTRARRAAHYDPASSDTLLAELSAAGGWDPARDERGVVVVLRDLFHGRELAPAGTSKLKELGRVAAAHPGFGVLLVVHDANAPQRTAPAPAVDAIDARRGDAALAALVSGGADPARIRVELAGARDPLVDPGVASATARNERLEVVFVSAGR
jgi:hypothetical protein